ncbi:hypothetical protein ACJIZ3_021389 [Penstemon smallii]|uniref:RING-type E3 ubiquitin transferase n=1 Tax=Penstemon smallii TaxID=265156 RepID=A0ABD3SLI9_9LAMI
MGDPPPPHPPVPPPPSLPPASFPMLYYGLVVVGTAAVVLALYNLVIIRWCADITNHRSRQRGSRIPGPTPSHSFRNLNMNFIYSYKYKKDGVEKDVEGNNDYECVVCLSVFEEGEELRQLPKCKHSFHASCIDMWLYSHMDCPLCRSPVEPPVPQRRAVTEQSGHSREVLLGPGSAQMLQSHLE